jgi:hypothetical protein
MRPPGLEKRLLCQKRQLLCDETFDLLAETNGKRYRTAPRLSESGNETPIMRYSLKHKFD